MTGHHLLIEDGRMNVECSEPPTAFCHFIQDCYCEDLEEVGTTDDGAPYHVPSGGDGDLHVGRFVPGWCNIADWFLAVEPEDLLSGEHAIPLRVEWGNDGPILHLPEQTEETDR